MEDTAGTGGAAQTQRAATIEEDPREQAEARRSTLIVAAAMLELGLILAGVLLVLHESAGSPSRWLTIIAAAVAVAIPAGLVLGVVRREQNTRTH